MIYRYVLFLLLGIDALILFLETSHISISYEEASLLYGPFSFLQMLVNLSMNIFGQNDFGLRFIMILMHMLSTILIYLISKNYIYQPRNRIWLVVVFILLPGVVSSAVVVNSAGIVILGLLFFIYLHDKIPQYLLNILLFVFALIDIGFSYLFLGLSLYYFNKKKPSTSLYMLGLYLITSLIYGFNIFGYPKGHLLDTIGVYSAIFTPIIFIYIFYTLYRRYLQNRLDIIWYVASITLILSLLLSFRQRIPIEDFAPYLIVALPLAGESFISSYRVRLKKFRTGYKLIFLSSFAFLILNTLVVFFNKELYAFIKNPKNNFAYDMHIAKELAFELKKRDIVCVNTNMKMQKRLYFYKVTYCKENLLIELNEDSVKEANVTISYSDKVLYKGYVTNINSL